MRKNEEYQLAKSISLYLKIQYPNILYHWDLSGLNLSKAQAGMSKAIQKQRGFPDLFIAQPVFLTDDNFNTIHHNGLFLEVKKEGTRLYKKDTTPVNDHIGEQLEYIRLLNIKGYYARIGIGFDECKNIIDSYLCK